MPDHKPQHHETVPLRVSHCSMEYCDSPAQMRHDVAAILGRKPDLLTFTEAGNNPLNDIFPAIGRQLGYRVHIHNACGVAVRNDIIGQRKAHPPVDRYWPIIDAGVGVGNRPPVGIADTTFWHTNPRVGRITDGAAHWPTKARAKDDPNFRLGVRSGQQSGRWATDRGEGKEAIVFLGADTNLVDANRDVFYGAPLTTAWDEVGRHENTGHGNIDVLASYDRDKRVTARSIRALDDGELHLFTDHFLVEAVFDIALLPLEHDGPHHGDDPDAPKPRHGGGHRG